MGSSAVPALWTPRELRHCLPLPSVWSGRRLLSWNCRDVAPFPTSLWLTARWDGRIPFTEPTLSHEAEPEKGGTNKKGKKERKSFLMRKGMIAIGLGVVVKDRVPHTNQPFWCQINKAFFPGECRRRRQPRNHGMAWEWKTRLKFKIASCRATLSLRWLCGGVG